MRRSASSLLLLTLLPVLAACPPTRDNVDDASGGYAEEAFFVWRDSPYGSAPLWGLLFVPRDDEHDCTGMLAYDWSDGDNDYARFNFSLARDLEWEGEFTNAYEGCGNWYDADRRCFDGFDWDEGEYKTFELGSTMTIDSWSADQVRGVAVDPEGKRLSFRAENCGEMPYYYWVGDAGSEPAATKSDSEPPRTRRWGLRFR